MLDRHLAARLDAWLTREPDYEPDVDDVLWADWSEHADEHDLSLRLADDDHPDHHVYEQWAVWRLATLHLWDLQADASLARWVEAEAEHWLTSARTYGDAWVRYYTARGGEEQPWLAEEFVVGIAMEDCVP